MSSTRHQKARDRRENTAPPSASLPPTPPRQEEAPVDALSGPVAASLGGGRAAVAPTGLSGLPRGDQHAGIPRGGDGGLRAPDGPQAILRAPTPNSGGTAPVTQDRVIIANNVGVSRVLPPSTDSSPSLPSRFVRPPASSDATPGLEFWSLNGPPSLNNAQVETQAETPPSSILLSQERSFPTGFPETPMTTNSLALGDSPTWINPRDVGVQPLSPDIVSPARARLLSQTSTIGGAAYGLELQQLPHAPLPPVPSANLNPFRSSLDSTASSNSDAQQGFPSPSSINSTLSDVEIQHARRGVVNHTLTDVTTFDHLRERPPLSASVSTHQDRQHRAVDAYVVCFGELPSANEVDQLSRAAQQGMLSTPLNHPTVLITADSPGSDLTSTTSTSPAATARGSLSLSHYFTPTADSFQDPFADPASPQPRPGSVGTGEPPSRFSDDSSDVHASGPSSDAIHPPPAATNSPSTGAFLVPDPSATSTSLSDQRFDPTSSPRERVERSIFNAALSSISTKAASPGGDVLGWLNKCIKGEKRDGGGGGEGEEGQEAEKGKGKGKGKGKEKEKGKSREKGEEKSKEDSEKGKGRRLMSKFGTLRDTLIPPMSGLSTRSSTTTSTNNSRSPTPGSPATHLHPDYFSGASSPVNLTDRSLTPSSGCSVQPSRSHSPSPSGSAIHLDETFRRTLQAIPTRRSPQVATESPAALANPTPSAGTRSASAAQGVPSTTSASPPVADTLSESDPMVAPSPQRSGNRHAYVIADGEDLPSLDTIPDPNSTATQTFIDLDLLLNADLWSNADFLDEFFGGGSGPPSSFASSSEVTTDQLDFISPAERLRRRRLFARRLVAHIRANVPLRSGPTNSRPTDGASRAAGAGRK